MARAQRLRSDDGIRVSGLNELNRALRTMGKEFQSELKDANRDAAEMVASGSRSAAYSLGGVAAKTAPSIKASVRTTAAAVSFGGTGYEFAGGAEFGSYRFRQFKPWRGNGSDAGYFLYPTIRRDADKIEGEYTDALDDLLRRNGLK
jgi:hypothetical protein